MSRPLRIEYPGIWYHMMNHGKRRDNGLIPPADEIISVVADNFKSRKEDIYRSKRGRANLPRDVAIYLIRLYCRETLAGIGQHFAIKKYSTISSTVDRIKSRKVTDKELQKQLDRIEAKLN